MRVATLVLLTLVPLLGNCADDQRTYVSPTSVDAEDRSTPSEPAAVTDRSVRSRHAKTRGGVSGEELTGAWGGDHIGLHLGAARRYVEFDCAHGTIEEPVIISEDGEFRARGTFVREPGGPISDTDVENPRPAIYSGRVTGDRMTLTITSDALPGPEHFTLVRHRPPNVVKCL